jgi:gas vesicle protein
MNSTGKINEHKLTALLNDVKNIIENEKKNSRIKGEDFNIFNLLKMTTNEVRTHSAFIAELLNPKGSHYMDDVFLKLFIEIIKPEFGFKADNKTKIEVEKSIGKVDNFNNKGGRIDIYLEDTDNHSIAIENKIYAADQEKQLVRYKLYKNENHSVIYLNLFGKEPDEISIKKSNDNGQDSTIDYQIISYKEHITKWLIKCEEKASLKPILRESIRQYRIIINQLTNSMSNNDKELQKKIKENLEEANYVANNYSDVVKKIQEKFRQNILSRLENEFKETFNCYMDGDIEKKYYQIWIKHKEKKDATIYFGIETFNGNKKARGGKLFIGIRDGKGTSEIKINNNYTFLDRWWPIHKELKFNDEVINLSEPKFLNLAEDEEFINVVVKQCIDFINDTKNILA